MIRSGAQNGLAAAHRFECRDGCCEVLPPECGGSLRALGGGGLAPRTLLDLLLSTGHHLLLHRELDGQRLDPTGAAVVAPLPPTVTIIS